MIDVPMEPEFLRLDHRLMELGGKVDFENRVVALLSVGTSLRLTGPFWHGGERPMQPLHCLRSCKVCK